MMLSESEKNSLNDIYFFKMVIQFLKDKISSPVQSCLNSKQQIPLPSILADSSIFEVPIRIMIAFSTNHYTNPLHICIYTYIHTL